MQALPLCQELRRHVGEEQCVVHPKVASKIFLGPGVAPQFHAPGPNNVLSGHAPSVPGQSSPLGFLMKQHRNRVSRLVCFTISISGFFLFLSQIGRVS